jgi:hypothetical protein
MGKVHIFQNLPVPALIINQITKELTTNQCFIDLLGEDIHTLDELKNITLKGGQFETIPTLTYDECGCIKNSNGKKIHVTFSYNKLDDNELIVTVQQFKLNVSQLFKNNDFRSIFNDSPFGYILSNLDTDETLWVSSYLVAKTGYTAKEIADLS